MYMINFYDPFKHLVDSFKKKYGEYDCIIQFDPDLGSVEGDILGETSFYDDESVLISVSSNISINHALDIMTHELAHLVVGYQEKDDHGRKWKKTYKDIHKNYDKYVKRLAKQSNNKVKY